jgi:hypothetical protein
LRLSANTAYLHAAMEFVPVGALEASMPEACIGVVALLESSNVRYISGLLMAIRCG